MYMYSFALSGKLMGDAMVNGQVEPSTLVMVCDPTTPVKVTKAPNSAEKESQMFVLTGSGVSGSGVIL
jgi:hypothetical protein